MRTIAIANLKGGCGKTTAAVHLAAASAAAGTRTLLVDLDPQAHATAAFGIKTNSIDLHPGDLLASPYLADAALDRLLWRPSESLHVAPAVFPIARLEAAASSLALRDDRDERLRCALDRLRERYDLVVVDTPPSLNLLAFNAILAADAVLVPADLGAPACLDDTLRQLGAIDVVLRAGRRDAKRLVLPNRRGDAAVGEAWIGRLDARLPDRLLRAPDGEPLALPNDAAYAKATLLAEPLALARTDALAAVAVARIAIAIEHRLVLAETSRAPNHEGEGSSWAERTTAADVSPHEPEVKSAALSIPKADPMPGLFERPSSDETNDLNACRSEASRSAASPPSGFVEPNYPSAGSAAPMGVAETSGTRPPPSPPAGRAAELAARTRAVAQQIERRRAERDASPSLADAVRRASARGPLALADPHSTTAHGASAADQASRQRSALRALLGVRSTAAGALFLIHAPGATRVAVQGDFDDWSPIGTPARFNHEAGLFELLLPLPPGDHAYRLVIDDVAAPDPANPHHVEIEGVGKASRFTMAPAHRATAARSA